MAKVQNLRWSKHAYKPYDGAAIKGDFPGIGYVDLALRIAHELHKFEDYDLKKAANVLRATRRQVYIDHGNRCLTEILEREAAA